MLLRKACTAPRVAAGQFCRTSGAAESGLSGPPDLFVSCFGGTRAALQATGRNQLPDTLLPHLVRRAMHAAGMMGLPWATAAAALASGPREQWMPRSTCALPPSRRLHDATTSSCCAAHLGPAGPPGGPEKGNPCLDSARRAGPKAVWQAGRWVGWREQSAAPARLPLTPRGCSAAWTAPAGRWKGQEGWCARVAVRLRLAAGPAAGQALGRPRGLVHVGWSERCKAALMEGNQSLPRRIPPPHSGFGHCAKLIAMWAPPLTC